MKVILGIPFYSFFELAGRQSRIYLRFSLPIHFELKNNSKKEFHYSYILYFVLCRVSGVSAPTFSFAYFALDLKLHHHYWKETNGVWLGIFVHFLCTSTSPKDLDPIQHKGLN